MTEKKKTHVRSLDHLTVQLREYSASSAPYKYTGPPRGHPLLPLPHFLLLLGVPDGREHPHQCSGYKTLTRVRQVEFY